MKAHLGAYYIERVYITFLLIIFGVIVLQAPITVAYAAAWPHASLAIKAWAEIMMGIAALMAGWLLYQKQQLRILKRPIMLLIASFVLLHVLLIPLFYQGFLPTIAGLLIDLRYVLFFALVYVAMQLFPQHRRAFLVVGGLGAAVVLGFALLQVFILPKDILKYIGYSKATIVPYLTVDLNNSFIRINSTLRGPNPLGAYAGMVVALIVAFVMRRRLTWNWQRVVAVVLLSLGGIVALWVSYSRSAVIAGIIAVVIAVSLSLSKKYLLRLWLIIVAAFVAGVLVVALAGHSSFFSNVVLHANPNGGSATKSDAGHVSSLAMGTKSILHHPLGQGIGSTGSASLFGGSPDIIENQYLFVAHESGWLGLILFIWILVVIFQKLWQKRHDWLVIGTLAGGIGLVIIGFLLPVFVDDTVSIVWWGVAALAIGKEKL